MRFAIVLFGCVLLFFIWGGLFYKIQDERQQEYDKAIGETANYTRAFDEHTVRTIKSMDQIALFLKYKAEKEGLKVDIPLLVREEMFAGQPYVQLGIADEKGNSVISSVVPFVQVNISDLEHFQVHQNRDAKQVFISKPMVGRTSGKASIQLTRRINKPDGSFGGVVVVSVSPDYFAGFYKELDLGKNSMITLIGNDGIVRVLKSSNEVFFGLDFRNSAIMENLSASRVGNFAITSRVDGVRRIYSYRTLNEYPMAVAVGVSEEEVYRKLEQRIAGYYVFCGAVSVSILLFMAMLLKGISRRRQTQEALTQSEERFRTVVTHTPLIIYALDKDGVFTLSEGLGLRKIGLKGGDVVGLSALEVYRDYPDIVKNLRRSLNGEAVYFDHSVGGTHFDNRMVPVFDNDGNVKAVFGAAIDISRRVEAEKMLQESHDQLEDKVEARTQELTAANEELRALNEEMTAMNEELNHTNERLQTMQNYLVQSEKMAALGNLVAGVAHEINTPIGVGVTAASHLVNISEQFRTLHDMSGKEESALGEYVADVNEGAAMILKNLERASRLIRSFKQVSVDQSSESLRSFPVKGYLEEILLSLNPQLRKTNLSVAVDCDPELKINSYPGALAQIVTNLIMNSLTHAYEQDASGQIRIAVEREADVLEIRYSDDGKGMPPAIVEKVFEPFYTTRRGSGGTGLGLFVVYNIVVRQLGGTIECHSELGRGATFTVKFPYKGD